jgi:DNA-binding transcriptional LysR family regulator
MHVTPFLPRFMAEYPAVELDLLVSDAVVNLVEQRSMWRCVWGAGSSSLIARRLPASPHRLRQPGLSGAAWRAARPAIWPITPA